jgi:AP2 domain
LNTIKTVDGYEVLVSKEDYDFIFWFFDLHIDKHGYVNCKLKRKRRGLGQLGGKLHRILMNPPEGREFNVDHIEGNKLDNRREKLRVISHHDNMRNRRKRNFENMSSKYKGVSWNQKLGAYKVYVRPDVNKNFYAGAFDDEVAAANAYNYYVKQLHGEYAVLNECPFMTKEQWEFKRRKNKTLSKYLGVSKCNNTGKWIMQLMHKGTTYSGRFTHEEDAAKKYNELASKLKGEKAKLNFI